MFPCDLGRVNVNVTVNVNANVSVSVNVTVPRLCGGLERKRGNMFMSRVYLLAADQPAPLYRAAGPRTRLVRDRGRQNAVVEDGFSVIEHEYYRPAVEELGYVMKPYRYELDLRATEEDLRQLRAYLAQNFAPGDEVELWGLWIGGGEARPELCRGPLDALDMETLEQLEENRPVCLTVEL